MLFFFFHVLSDKSIEYALCLFFFIHLSGGRLCLQKMMNLAMMTKNFNVMHGFICKYPVILY